MTPLIVAPRRGIGAAMTGNCPGGGKEEASDV